MITRIFWVYPLARPTLFDLGYRGFNLLEAAIWFLCAGLVLRRWWRNHRSRFEPAYAGAFLLFGLTDVREAFQLDVPLLAVKLVVLIALGWLRWKVRPLYPGSTLL